jgi:hypothetical protein
VDLFSAFDLNEELKERCILLGVKECYTRYVDDPKYQDSPFWFNVIKMPPTMNKKYVMAVCAIIDNYLEEFDFLGVGDQSNEVMLLENNRYVVYCFYCDKEKFFKKIERVQ